ncbi:hypothetical protein OPT61_g3685 [Boeremia exigua]|uniref:Uncharacterized protein n=1 Tax=Boeremia exigua TaxID=749465 RepID=A0ACC2IH10_9PLEO|nr:hypothetical protein OPT61_g3685 [Boeremia exigua]
MVAGQVSMSGQATKGNWNDAPHDPTLMAGQEPRSPPYPRDCGSGQVYGNAALQAHRVMSQGLSWLTCHANVT